MYIHTVCTQVYNNYCTSLPMHACTCVHIYVCTYVCMHAHMYFRLTYTTQVIAKLNHFDPSALHKLCWECFCASHDPQLVRVITMVSQQSALFLWHLFCKLDTEGKMKLHPEVRTLCILLPSVTVTELKVNAYIYAHMYM